MANHERALPGLSAGGDNVLARFHRTPNRDPAVDLIGVFHHDNGIASRRDRRAGHDFSRLAVPNFHVTLRDACSSSDFADQAQANRNIGNVGGSHGITIACRTRKRREITVGEKVLRQHQSEGIEQGEHLGIGWRDCGGVLLNGLTRVGEGWELGFGYICGRHDGCTNSTGSVADERN
jgi:hypothetical protein